MKTEPTTSAAERAAYAEERAYWVRAAGSHFDEAQLPFIRWHQEQVVAHLAPPRDELIVEVGCGPGKLLRDFPRVLLVDFSPEILARARREHPHFLAVCASVDALPFADHSIRHLLANNMLHHVKGEGLLEPALDEFARVLAPAGRLYVNDRNPTLLHHLSLLAAMATKQALRGVFGEFSGCGSFNEPLFTRRDWAAIARRFHFRSSHHYYTVGMWLVDSLAKLVAVLARRKDRGLLARMQARSLPALLRLERRARLRPLCLERSVVAEPAQPEARASKSR